MQDREHHRGPAVRPPDLDSGRAHFADLYRVLTQPDAERPAGGNVVDLMAALKKSLEGKGGAKSEPTEKKPAARKPSAKKASDKEAPAKKAPARKRA